MATKKKTVIVRLDDIPTPLLKKEELVDLSDDWEKPVKSKFIEIDDKPHWRAVHHQTGVYFTPNDRDPKILNFVSEPPRPRGNKNFTTGKVAVEHGGRKKGSKNHQTVNSICGNLNIHPAELLAGIASGDPALLRKYRIKDPKAITIAHKIKCSEILVNKLEGNAKPVERDEEGNIISVQDPNKEQGKGLQVFLSAPKQEIASVESEGVEAYLERSGKEYEYELYIG